MSNYPLYPPKLMQVGSFCYASKDFRPSLREEEIVGIVGCALDEKTEEARKRYEKFQVLGTFEPRMDNIFLAQFDTMTLDSYKDYKRMETPKKIYFENFKAIFSIYSKVLLSYCDVLEESSLPKRILIVARTRTQVFYKHLVDSTIETIKYKKSDKDLFEYNQKKILNDFYKRIIEIDDKKRTITYAKLAPENKINTAYIKPIYVEEIEEIYEYANNNNMSRILKK